MADVTAQQQADFWAREVMQGRGQWISRLRIDGLADCAAPVLSGVTRDPDQKIIFASAVLIPRD